MEYGLVALWLGAFLGIGVLALPLSSWLFPEWGGAFAVPLGLATLAVVGHLVGHVAFGLPAALVGLGALAALSAIAADRAALDWRGFVEAAVVFVLGFLLIAGVRSLDPAAAPLPLSIGEKMLDFGLLRTLERTATLPPEDMWFAGQAVRYHYGGHMLTALVATLTGTSARYAYNLGLAGFYATLVATAYGLASAFADRYAAPRRLAGALGVFFVGLAGNLSIAARVVGWLLPRGIARWVVGLAGLDPSQAAWTPAQFGYFGPTRVLPIHPGDPDSFKAATEFPLFAWVNGDLHAHMMSQPFVLLVGALLFAYWRYGDRPRRRALVLFGAVPPVVGLIGVVNIWSFPTAGALAGLAVLFAPSPPLGAVGAFLPSLETPDHWLATEARRLGVAAGATLAVFVLAVLWTAPYWVLVVAGGPAMTPAYWGPWSPLGGLLLVHGAFLLAVVPPLSARAGATSTRPWVDAALVLAFVVATVALGAPALGLFGSLVLVGWWLLRTAEDVGFPTVLVVAAAGLVLLVEVVTLKGERFNVIFKAYADVWLFLSVAAGVYLARFASGWPTDRLSIGRERWRLAGRVLVAVLVLTTGLYAAFLLPSFPGSKRPSWSAEEQTLDATAYLEPEFPREAPAIRWLDNRSGRPTIVTAAPGGYRWNADEGKGASAPASLTGLPAVLGWFHERQYRGDDAYRQRLADVETIYTGRVARQARLLREYDVRYVYVGPAERAQYDGISVGAVPGVSVAREWERVTIYRVNRSQLPR
ncbi:MAG: DUF2298 domain-containing protein [Haloarculaceae archaeon]